MFIVGCLFLLTACQTEKSPQGKLSIGVVSFGEKELSLEKYSELKQHLASKLNKIIELEPTYNEVQALQQIERQSWDLIIAPPGLAAIAIVQSNYQPIFSLEGVLNTRSIIVVQDSSPIQKLSDLNNQIIALGQPGSATGYYLPIYNLYGLTLAEVLIAPTPKTILEWITEGKVVAGALSFEEFNRYRADFPATQFRILYTDSHEVPSGAILANPNLDPQPLEQLKSALSNVSGAIASSAGYLPNAPIPDYEYLIEVVNRVTPIAGKIKEKPAHLY